MTGARESMGGAREGGDVTGESRVLAAVVERVRVRAACRSAWFEHLIADAGAASPARVAAHLAAHDERDAERAFLETPGVAPLCAALRSVEGALARDDASRLNALVELFSLGAYEVDALHTCLAVAVEPSIGRLLGFLTDPDRAYVSEGLVRELFGHPRTAHLPSESGLRTFDVLHEADVAPGAPRALTLDADARAWLCGTDELDRRLVGCATLVAPRKSLRRWPVESTADRVRSLIAAPGRNRVRIVVRGPERSGRSTFASLVAERLGLRLLAVDTAHLSEGSWENVYVRAQRQAYFGRAALAFRGTCSVRRPAPAAVAPFPLQFILVEEAEIVRPAPDVADIEVQLEGPELEERIELWRELVPAASAWDEASLTGLASTHRVQVGDIAEAAAKGVESVRDARDAVRGASRKRMGDLAERLECPFEPDDLVLPAALRRELDDLVFEATERPSFWADARARRLFPQGRGLIALFSGPAGTGKTMAAQMLAARLGTELYRINLASIVSKWVGETSRNLEVVLSRAATTDVVLLFDEADALFAKRTSVEDAQDRFANTDTNYLLQAIESFQGVAILASNRKGNMDAAFLRRLRYTIEFPVPDEAMRAELWRSILLRLTSDADAARLDVHVRALASAVEVTGAQIKASLLHAVFAARRDGRPVEVAHVLRGLERELMKEGRTLMTRARERFAAHG